MIQKLQSSKPTTVRCAVYTRKSTEDGLEQEFNSLDAQRESGEAYITSQQSEGWVCLPTLYDDGGFSGGNMERPALRRLMRDIEDGKVDCVIVYKVDRLSRSLMDFSKIVEAFDRHGVSFVSVTQQFNTASSMGRLILNVLLSFAQFEREMISERTRDKIAATRRKGKWSGGMPLLGYTVENGKLQVEPHEAERVRQIFELYVKTRSMITTVKECHARGWETKRWTTKTGIVRGGKPFTKGYLYQLLNNVVYVGKVRYKKEIHQGEHQGIIDPDLFEKVKKTMSRRNRKGNLPSRKNYAALLRGILHCAHCNRAMGHTASDKGARRYRYYVCRGAQQKGYGSCPAPSISASELERFVIDEIRSVGTDDSLAREVFARSQQTRHLRLEQLHREADSLRGFLRLQHSELEQLAKESNSSVQTDMVADVHSRITRSKSRLIEIDEECECIRTTESSLGEVREVLMEFDELWESMPLQERSRLIELLIERVDYDGAAGKIKITFHPTGIASLGEALAIPQEATA